MSARRQEFHIWVRLNKAAVHIQLCWVGGGNILVFRGDYVLGSNLPFVYKWCTNAASDNVSFTNNFS